MIIEVVIYNNFKVEPDIIFYYKIVIKMVILY